MAGANHGQLQYEQIAGRQMANVDDRRGCGIVFQRRQPSVKWSQHAVHLVLDVTGSQ
jgi:hypothetical protein